MLNIVENSIWHAFDFIAVETNRTCAKKSKLKVLTANIGHILDVGGVEKGLDDFRSTPTLTFNQYRYYLQNEVFNALPDQVTVEDQRNYERKIDDVCWLICNPLFLERSNPVFPDCCVYQLWRVFCMLGEMVTEDEFDESKLEIVMAASEVETLISQFLSSVGQEECWDPEEFDSMVSVIPAFKFSIFLAVTESKYALKIDPESLKEAVRDIHDQYLHDVIKKGKLKKQMIFLPTFREGWWVVQPQQLTVFTSWEEKEIRGFIHLDKQCRVEPMKNEESGRSLTPVKQRPHRFVLFAGNQKTYQFQASNHRSRLQWISAIKKAIDSSGPGIRYQITQAKQRQQARAKDLRRQLSHVDDIEQTRAELEAEKERREEAEAEAAMLTEEMEVETKRLKELEDIKHELEQLLEEEKQAKKDEEIVRAIQARMLTEEWEKREMLERLQEEQREMLQHERNKREEYENVGVEREQKVQEAEKRVQELEEERKRLDDELKKHREKARRVNIGQEVLETKMKVKEQEAEIEKKEAASRVPSLNPSASFYVRKPGGRLGDNDNNGYRPMRSASMRETSYSRSIRRRNRVTDNISIRSNCNIEEVNNNK